MNNTNVTVLDFETYYSSKHFSLSKIGTQKYILSPQFQTIGLSVWWPREPAPIWYPGEQVHGAIARLKADPALVIAAHNAQYDASVLSWRYDVHPALIIDTMSLARATGVSLAKGASLSALADTMREAGIAVPPKGTEVVAFDGYRLENFRPQDLDAYGRYCSDDVRITYELMQQLQVLVPPDEILWQDAVHKMYTERRLKIDPVVVSEELARVRERRRKAIDRVIERLGGDPMILARVLNSNPKYAEALELFGAEVPMKKSPATGKETFAFAKTDVAFLAMQDHEIPEVAALVDARLSLKSSIDESRCETFLELAALGPVPIPYKVSGAHTHRLGGGEA